MRVVRSKKWVVLLSALALAAASAAIALSASSTQVIADSHAVHLEVQRSTFTNYDSGWHVHPGLVVVQVLEGSVQFYNNSCTPKTVNAGDFTIEPAYLPMRAISAHAVVTTIFIVGSDPVKIPLSQYSPGAGNPCPSLG